MAENIEDTTPGIKDLIEYKEELVEQKRQELAEARKLSDFFNRVNRTENADARLQVNKEGELQAVLEVQSPGALMNRFLNMDVLHGYDIVTEDSTTVVIIAETGIETEDL